MNSRYDESAAAQCTDDLAMRVYTSRLLGEDENLVLHGGGNTSVKIDEWLYVKGSGWDLATIQKEGFPAVRMDALIEMAKLEKLSDSEMVRLQREAMRDQSFPNPSIEAILHAIIPFRFVDHTHADAIATISNTPNGRERLEELYGKSVLFVPYIMPGFDLAHRIHEMTKDVNWSDIEAIILDNHGIFTFSDSAKQSYERMIELVAKAQNYLDENAPLEHSGSKTREFSKEELQQLSNMAEKLRGSAVVALPLEFDGVYEFCRSDFMGALIAGGPLTPEHVIRTKPRPAVLEESWQDGFDDFARWYEAYFQTNNDGTKTMLDSSPRWAVIKYRGIVTFGANEKEAIIIGDIVRHTVQAMLRSRHIGGWKSLSKADIFAMEYWELEQAKLRKAAK